MAPLFVGAVRSDVVNSRLVKPSAYSMPMIRWNGKSDARNSTLPLPEPMSRNVYSVGSTFNDAAILWNISSVMHR